MDATRRGTKFGLLAIKDASAHITGNIDLGATPGEIAAHAACPITLPTHWQEWLGTIQTEDIHEANLTVAIQIDSATPDILDQESKDVEQRLVDLWHGLRLNGIPNYSTALLLIGAIRNDGQLSIRHKSTLALSYRHPCGVLLDIDEAVLRRAVSYGDALRAIFASTGNYRRLRAGYRALAAGIEEVPQEERLHLFVRALDGLMAIPRGPGQTVFATRGLTFVDAANVDPLLTQMYVLRNTQEHLNDFRPVVAAPNDDEFRRIVSARAYQAEQAALAVYRRIADAPAVRAHFFSDPSTDAFWALDATTRAGIWGARVDLDAIEADHNYRYALLTT